ncbi:hypothetical protein [Candidatus Sororendozoicomonas aggregata]
MQPKVPADAFTRKGQRAYSFRRIMLWGAIGQRFLPVQSGVNPEPT